MPRWTRRCFLTLLPVLVLFTALAPARQDEPVEKTVRLGTWNIEWLGNAAKRRKAAQDPEDIAKYIQASKVDLLGLNEITHDVEGAEPRSKTLTEAFKIMSKDARADWKHLLFPSEDKDHKDQLCGVAWNNSVVKLVGEPFRIPIRRGPAADENLWRRHPYAVKFSFGEKKTDVVLIPVHMKSNRGGITKMSKVRAEEANTLVRALAAVQNHFKDDDIIILGDLNCLLREEPALVRFRTTGFRDLNFADEASWIKERIYDPAPFDRILVPEDQPEFKGCRFSIFKDHHFANEKEYRTKLSDHYLVFTDIRVMDDDD
jgi:endonuclease/exonuclease/phosphatase family metal-dependent hydrolase